jgi:hypothetical protein
MSSLLLFRLDRALAHVELVLLHCYWSAGGAPTGTYKVYVNFYDAGLSGASNRSSDYTVLITAFGNTKTYTGTVTSSTSKVLVATFDSNGVITAAERSLVIPESRSVLPSKALLPETYSSR